METLETKLSRIHFLNDWANWGALIVLGILALVVGCRKSVQLSSGMAPTIKAGERVTVNYAAYTFSTPRRWDVVALAQPGYSNIVVLKRVIALPSETISLTSSGIVVNAKPLSFPASLSNVVYCPPEKLSTQMTPLVKFPYTVPPNQYFVVGDNWTNSLDSRFYGAVPLTNILGKVRNK